MPAKKSPQILPTARTPTPYLFREVKPDWSGLFAKLGDFDLAKPQKWPSTLHNSLVALFKLEPRTSGEEALLPKRHETGRSTGRYAERNGTSLDGGPRRRDFRD